MARAPLAQARRRVPAAVGLAAGVALVCASGTMAQGATIVVDPSADIPAKGATVSVTGSGFSTTGNGVYVVFGPVTPAPDYYLDPSIYGAFRWVHAGAGGSPIEADLGADGSFATTLDVMSAFTTSAGDVDCTLVPCAVITFAAHGSPDRSQDLCVALTFAPSTDAGASLVVGMSPSPSAVPGGPSPSTTPEVSAPPASADACSLIGAPAP